MILIIEDAALSRKLLAKILKPEGHTLLEARNGREGLEMMQKYKPDCIILDLLMPEVGGIEVLQIMRQKNLTIPTIVLTADVQQTTQQACLELGAATVLNKIPKIEELRHWLQITIGVSRQGVNCEPDA
nr:MULTISPECIES: response regulator [unclassified Desertifilum]